MMFAATGQAARRLRPAEESWKKAPVEFPPLSAEEERARRE